MWHEARESFAAFLAFSSFSLPVGTQRPSVPDEWASHLSPFLGGDFMISAIFFLSLFSFYGARREILQKGTGISIWEI